MQIFRLENMKSGWFIGAFEPSVCFTAACEVAVKKYKKGSLETAHYHAKATEITLILEGSAIMCNQQMGSGDIICLDPFEVTSFEALTDVVTVVIKLPSVADDKYSV